MPWYIWALEGVIAILMIVCIVGLTLSIKVTKKLEKLKSASDMHIMSNKGRYFIYYMSKFYFSERSVKIKLIMCPVLQFSFYKTNPSNHAVSLNLCVYNCSSTSEPIHSQEYELNELLPSVEFEIDKSYITNNELNLVFNCKSRWVLHGLAYEESMLFDVKKTI